MPKVHRDRDRRICGHITIARRQSTVFANHRLVAVNLDQNNAGGGNLIAHSNEVYAENILTVNHTMDTAQPDSDYFRKGSPHGSPNTAEGSDNVYSGDPIDDYNPFVQIKQAYDIPTIYLSEDRVEEVIRQRKEDATPNTNEYIEYGDGGVGSSSPVTNETGPLGAPGSPNVKNGEQPKTATLDPDQPESTSEFSESENTHLLNFLPHTDPRIKPELRSKLENLARSLGETLTITSAYRSPEYNKRVGGAKSSQHMLGNATDITMRGKSSSQRADFIQKAINAGLTGIGLYNTFIHVDIGPKRYWGSPNKSSFPTEQNVLRQNGY